MSCLKGFVEYTIKFQLNNVVIKARMHEEALRIYETFISHDADDEVLSALSYLLHTAHRDILGVISGYNKP